MPGEKRICNSISSIRWSLCAPKTVGSLLYDGYNKEYKDTYLGSIHFTNYRIIISSTAARDVQLYGKPHSRHYVPDFFGQISIPLNTIVKFHTVAPGALTSNNKTYVNTGFDKNNNNTTIINYNPLGSPTLLYIYCKDVRVVKIIIYPGRLSMDALLTISEPSTPNESIDGSNHGAISTITPRSNNITSNTNINNTGITICNNVPDLVNLLTKFSFPFNTIANNNNPQAYLLNTSSTSSKTTFNNGVSIDTSSNVFAFKFRMTFQERGWELSDILKDYVRQGILGMRDYRVN